jgi:hypothetical protein
VAVISSSPNSDRRIGGYREGVAISGPELVSPSNKVRKLESSFRIEPLFFLFRVIIFVWQDFELYTADIVNPERNCRI